MPHRTRDIDIERAAAQLAEGARLAEGASGCVRFDIPHLDNATWLPADELEDWRREVLTVLMPDSAASDDEELYGRCKELLTAALEIHTAACGLAE